MSVLNTIELCPSCGRKCSCDELANNAGICDTCDFAAWAEDMERRSQILAWEEKHGCPAV